MFVWAYDLYLLDDSHVSITTVVPKLCEVVPPMGGAKVSYALSHWYI